MLRAIGYLTYEELSKTLGVEFSPKVVRNGISTEALIEALEKHLKPPYPILDVVIDRLQCKVGILFEGGFEHWPGAPIPVLSRVYDESYTISFVWGK